MDIIDTIAGTMRSWISASPSSDEIFVGDDEYDDEFINEFDKLEIELQCSNGPDPSVGHAPVAHADTKHEHSTNSEAERHISRSHAPPGPRKNAQDGQPYLDPQTANILEERSYNAKPYPSLTKTPSNLDSERNIPGKYVGRELGGALVPLTRRQHDNSEIEWTIRPSEKYNHSYLWNELMRKCDEVKKLKQDLQIMQKQHTVEIVKLNKLLELETRLKLSQEMHSDSARKSQREINELQRHLNAMQEELNRKVYLLDQRTDELKMVDAYISRTNRYSDIELKGKVEMLNQEVSQTCSTIIDALDFSARNYTALSETHYKRLLSDFGQLLPHPFLNYIAHRCSRPANEMEEPWISIALQAVMVERVCFYAQSWCPLDEGVTDYMKSMYQGLKSSNSFTAPQWRSMSRSEIRRRNRDDKEVEACRSALWERIISMLSFCGWSAEYLKGTQHLDAIVNGISIIANKTLKLNQALLEDTLQAEAELVGFAAGRTFDSKYVDGSFSAGADKLTHLNQSANVVLCTTDLGLRIVPPGGSPRNIVKPKVILEVAFYQSLKNEQRREKGGRI
ncbi:hypothetical protein AX16_004349 [Volvariella volvacea WC 439]|nr:hypothetical protein AX16_004349 [Volvariella volvacea WC 439]